MDQCLQGGRFGLEAVRFLLVDALATMIGMRCIFAFCKIDTGAGGTFWQIAVTLALSSATCYTGCAYTASFARSIRILTCSITFGLRSGG